MRRAGIAARLAEVERRFAHRVAGVHRLTDDELEGLIARLKQPDPAHEAWALSVLHRERLI